MEKQSLLGKIRFFYVFPELADEIIPLFWLFTVPTLKLLNGILKYETTPTLRARLEAYIQVKLLRKRLTLVEILTRLIEEKFIVRSNYLVRKTRQLRRLYS